jgi:hypothetical protein
VLLNPQHYTYYHWKFHPGLIEYAALVANVLILAGLLWGAMTLARRSGKQWLIQLGRWIFLFALLIPINNLRLQIFDPLASANGNRLGYILFFGPFLALVLLVIVLKRRRAQLFRATVVVVLILFPFFIIALLQGAWITFKFRNYAQLAGHESPAPPLNSNKQNSPRVVWLVFDELEQRSAFAERSAGLELKEFDRLRSEALFSTNAYAPESATLLSMPALIIGKSISSASPESPKELTLTLRETNEQVTWSTQPNIFAAARAEGVDTALVGWYHPYCRVIGNSLTSCFWQPVVDAISPIRGEPTLIKSMYYWAETALFAIPGMFRVFKSSYDSDRGEAHIEEHLLIMEQAKIAARKREFGLTLLHFPIPHHPFIYDRQQGKFSASPDRTYEDNLVLADNTLGEIRREMENSGLWDGTTVIVSSDHYWRTNPKGTSDQRIPFILKLAGQKTGMTYDSKINTLITSELIKGMLKGELTTPESVIQWLDRNRPMPGVRQ